jgi:hypothetical protein
VVKALQNITPAAGKLAERLRYQSPFGPVLGKYLDSTGALSTQLGYLQETPGYTSAWRAGRAELGAAQNKISPEEYDIMTAPFASGVALDRVMQVPRFQRFDEMVLNMARDRMVRSPRDVYQAARVFDRTPNDVREIALQLMADGMPVEDALRAARLL